MANGYSRKKLWRHGSVSLGLTVTVIAALVLINTIFSTLAARYGWYVNMNPTLLFPVSESCYDYLDSQVMDATDEKITFMFCMTKEEAEASETQRFIYKTAVELAERYPDRIEITYTNIYENPSYARELGINAISDVAVMCNEQVRVCNATDFFAFSAADSSTPTAYMGDRRFAVAMRAVTQKDTPVCYFTINHGEALLDNEIMHTIVDAGYNVSYMDLLSYDIPDDCDMIITYNPTRDFTVEDGTSSISEIQKLEQFMARGGKFAVFTSADTFLAGGYENLEGFLAKWGVRFDHKTTDAGREECYAVRDMANALSSDGYTFLAETAYEGIDGSVRVANSGIIRKIEGFDNVETVVSTHAGAEAFAAGRATERTTDGFALMTLTTSTDGGALLACSSIDFASETSMQNGVYANKDVLLSAIGDMGKDAIPLGIAAHPLTGSQIRTLTTKTATVLTVVLTAAPAVILFAVGAFILIRRRYA